MRSDFQPFPGRHLVRPSVGQDARLTVFAFLVKSDVGGDTAPVGKKKSNGTDELAVCRVFVGSFGCSFDGLLEHWLPKSVRGAPVRPDLNLGQNPSEVGSQLVSLSGVSWHLARAD